MLFRCSAVSNGGQESAYDNLEAISICMDAFPNVEFFQITVCHPDLLCAPEAVLV